MAQRTNARIFHIYSNAFHFKIYDLRAWTSMRVFDGFKIQVIRFGEKEIFVRGLLQYDFIFGFRLPTIKSIPLSLLSFACYENVWCLNYDFHWNFAYFKWLFAISIRNRVLLLCLLFVGGERRLGCVYLLANAAAFFFRWLRIVSLSFRVSTLFHYATRYFFLFFFFFVARSFRARCLLCHEIWMTRIEHKLYTLKNVSSWPRFLPNKQLNNVAAGNTTTKKHQQQQQHNFLFQNLCAYTKLKQVARRFCTCPIAYFICMWEITKYQR